MQLSFRPTLDGAETGRRLRGLLEPGSLQDPEIERRIGRLALAFRRYADCYPLPLWAPGLVIENQMRGWTEALFPISQLRSVFELVLRRGCRFAPLLSASYLHSSPSWLDLLHRLRPQPGQADPAAMLRELAHDGQKRAAFLFSLLLPHHFGGTFDRYPRQSEWIGEWLEVNAGRWGELRALDSACGSGEGTYGLAELFHAAGLGKGGSEVHGSTLEPIELFAAAHAFFPHDPDRERDFRRRVAPLLARPDASPMEFYLEEVGAGGRSGHYQLILCNGLLGGPLMHETGGLSRAVAALARRLAPGGVLLAADRFHAGWRARVPAAALVGMMREQGLTPLPVPEGIAGEKPG